LPFLFAEYEFLTLGTLSRFPEARDMIGVGKQCTAEDVVRTGNGLLQKCCSVVRRKSAPLCVSTPEKGIAYGREANNLRRTSDVYP
jgi:hypothetical protein